MTEWNKTKEYLIFYSKDESIIPRRDIRNQLKDAVAEGDKLQSHLWGCQEGYKLQMEAHHEVKQKLEAIQDKIKKWNKAELDAIEVVLEISEVLGE